MENKFENAAKQLNAGDVVTVIVNNDFGFVSTFSCKVVEAKHTSYAQYRNSLYLIFKEPRQKKARAIHLHEGKRFLVLRGKHEIKNDIYDEPEVVGECIVRTGKYSSCDPRWFEDAQAQVKDIEPLIYNQKDY